MAKNDKPSRLISATFVVTLYLDPELGPNGDVEYQIAQDGDNVAEGGFDGAKVQAGGVLGAIGGSLFGALVAE